MSVPSSDRIMRRAMLGWHRLVARSGVATAVYMRALAASRGLLPTSVAARLCNNLHGVSWPDVTLPALPVQMGRQTTVRVRPHFGEFDLTALVSRQLGYEDELVAWLEARVPQYDVIVEIGANVGVYTAFFGVLLREAGRPDSRVFAFEPSRTAFARLLDNLHANNLQNVTCFNAAVGSRTGMTMFYEPRGHLTNGSLYPAFARLFAEDVTAVPTLCLDGAEIGAQLSSGAKTLLKIDVEGAEAIVLESLDAFIRQQQPDIVIEVLTGYEAAIMATAPLRDGHYRMHAFTETGPVERAELRATEFRDWWLEPKVGLLAKSSA